MTPTAVVRPLPGPGLVARSGELLLVCADGAAGVEELLGLVAEVSSAGGDGSVLVRRVAALLAADFSGRFPACAASGPTADGRLALLVHGSALATVVGGDGEITLSAADAITSVNRLVPGPISAVRLELPGAGPANALARLEAGVITAAGIVSGDSLLDGAGRAPAQAPFQSPSPLLEQSAPAPEGAWSASSMLDKELGADWPPAQLPSEPVVPFPRTVPPPDLPRPPDVRPGDGGPGGGWSDDFPPREPLPQREPQASGFPPPVQVDAFDSLPQSEAPSLREPDGAAPFVSVLLGGSGDTAPPPAAPGVDARPTVLGLSCMNGHLNDPSSEACITCGASMVGQPPVMREGPRPPLGALLLDDGAAFVLDVDYLLGREPQNDPEVIAGTVRPLKITDADGVVSRKHVRVALVGWEIQVIDLGSANGTYVQHPGDPQSHQLVAHQPIVVRPGSQVTMGRRWFRVEALNPEVTRFS